LIDPLGTYAQLNDDGSVTEHEGPPSPFGMQFESKEEAERAGELRGQGRVESSDIQADDITGGASTVVSVGKAVARAVAKAVAKAVAAATAKKVGKAVAKEGSEKAVRKGAQNAPKSSLPRSKSGDYYFDEAAQVSIGFVDGYDAYGEEELRPQVSPDGKWVAW